MGRKLNNSYCTAILRLVCSTPEVTLGTKLSFFFLRSKEKNIFQNLILKRNICHFSTPPPTPPHPQNKEKRVVEYVPAAFVQHLYDE